MIGFRRVFLVLFKWACRCSKQFVSSKLFCSQKKNPHWRRIMTGRQPPPETARASFQTILFHAEVKMIAYLMIWRSVEVVSGPTTCQKILLNKYLVPFMAQVPSSTPYRWMSQIQGNPIKIPGFSESSWRDFRVTIPNLELRGLHSPQKRKTN